MKSHRDLFLCAVLTLAVWTAAQGVFLTDPYRVNDDVRQQLFWMQRFQDPALYPPDLLNEYARSYVPWGVRGLYHAASFLIDPLAFSKLLTAFTFTLSGLLLFRLGERLGGRAAGWTAAMLIWLYPLPLHNMAGGLARSLALPLILLFLTAWVERTPMLLRLALLLQALCIPYAFPPCALALGLSWSLHVLQRLRKKPADPMSAPHVLTLCVLAAGTACILLWRGQMAGLGFGPLPAAAQLAADPVFTADGRFRIWPIPTLAEDVFFTPPYYFFGMQDWPVAGHIAGVIVFCALFFFSIRTLRKRGVKDAAPYLFFGLACLCMYVAAYAAALRLFIPSRQVEYAVNIAVCLLFGLGLGLAWEECAARLFPARARLLSGLLIVLAACGGGLRLYGQGLYDYSAYAPLYAALRGLPKDALLAGHPRLMDNALTFGRRNVLASEELAHPWSLGYWARFEPRLRASLNALYAKDMEPITALRGKYGVTHLVVDDRELAADFIQKRPLFAPYNGYIRELAAKPGPFVLAPDGPLPGKEVQPGVRLIPLTALPSAQDTGNTP